MDCNLLGFPTDPPFETDAALYFLSSGDYLFRQVQAGRARSKFVTARDVAAAFSQKEIDTGWLPAGVVRCGHNIRGPWFVYSAPAQKVDIFLSPDAPAQLTVPIPRTVLVGVGQVYYLWASRSKHFNREDRVFHAPFPNIYSDGKICWGRNAPPEADPAKARQVWSLFFEAPFNRDLATSKSNAEPSDVRKQLSALAEAGAKSYPLTDLIAGPLTLEQVIANAIGER